METVPDRADVDAQREQFRAAKADPVAFFSRRENWPKVLCEEVLFETTFFYANRVLREAGGRSRQPGDWSAFHYARLWPLPVGRAALRARVQQIRERETQSFHGDPSALSDAMPFDGMELAGWILDARVGTARVEAFGLVRVEPDLEDLIIDRMVFRLTGSTVTSHDVRALCDDVAKWWATLGGQRVVKMGRHYGRKNSRDDVTDAYRAFYDQMQRFPDQQEVATELGVTAKTVRRTIGQPWPTFEQETRSTINSETH